MTPLKNQPTQADMIKTSFIALRDYQHTLKASVKSHWFALWAVIPISVYLAYYFTEDRLLGMIGPQALTEEGKSLEFYRDLFRLLANEMLWMSGMFMVAWILARYAPLHRIFQSINSSIADHRRLVAAVIMVVSFVASVHIAFNTLEAFPNSSDEYAYLYQARSLSNGNLWEAAHQHEDFFHFNHIAQKDGISVSRFPPGWPFILNAFIRAGINPAWANPMLGLILLLVFYSFARRFYNPTVAVWALACLALTSYFMFNAASYFSHTSCALFVLLFVYGVYSFLESRGAWKLVAAGFAIGFVVVTRYYTAILIFIPIGIFLVNRLRWESIRVFLWMGMGGLIPLGGFLWYNYSITGNALLPVTLWAYADESLGFVRGHTFWKGIEHVIRWMGMFLYWVSPAMLIIYFVALTQRKKGRVSVLARPEDYFFIILVIGYFFYYEIGGNQYGPRFFFEAFPFLILFVVDRILSHKEKWTMALLLSGMLFAIVRIPFIAQREHQVVEERLDLYRTVSKQRISNAVVFVSSYTGVIRPMPKGDLTRNDVYHLNDVLYAIDLGERNKELMSYYPERNFYRYHREPGRVMGELERIE